MPRGDRHQQPAIGCAMPAQRASPLACVTTKFAGYRRCGIRSLHPAKSPCPTLLERHACTPDGSPAIATAKAGLAQWRQPYGSPDLRGRHKQNALVVGTEGERQGPPSQGINLRGSLRHRPPTPGGMSERCTSSPPSTRARRLPARSLAHNEAFTRIGNLPSFLSISFVALALIAQATSFADPFLGIAAITLTFDFVIGLITFGRILGTTSDDLRAVQGMTRVRHGYVQIAPHLEPYFSDGTTDDREGVMRSRKAACTAFSMP